MGSPWLVLTAGLLATAVAVAGLVASGRMRDRARFERASESARQRVEARLDIYVALLRSASGLVAADPGLTAAGFRTYVGRLGVREHYPGIQGIGLTRRVSAAQVPALAARMRAGGFPDFEVRPADRRAEYHPIMYLEPLDARNTAAIGFDMFAEPIRREAMERARDSGEPAMSGKVRLVQEIAGPAQAGFLIYVPVYRSGASPAATAARRETLAGFAYAPFRADDLFAGIFGAAARRDVELRLYDGPEIRPAALLHASDTTGSATPPRARWLVDTLALRIAGRPWTMVVQPGAAFDSSTRHSLALLAAIVGLAASLALFALTRARHRAVRAVARARDLLGQVLEQAPVAICVLRGPEHVFQLANPAYRKLVIGNPIGLPLRDVVPEADEHGLVGLLDRVYATGEPWVGHGVELHYDRTGAGDAAPAYFNVLYYPFRGPEGRPVGVIAVAVEVTAEVRARQDAELARRDAELANRAKSDFLAAMSHELRTPLNAITGYVELIEIGIHGPVTREQQGALHRIRRSAGHLLSLINDVLNFAKLEAGRVEFDVRRVPLRAAVEDVVHMIEPQLTAKDLWCRVQLPDGLMVTADAEKLRQILLNLLSNAVKFTEEGGITVDVASHDEGRVCLRVIDTGIGIPEDRLGSIFDPFVQVNRTLSSRTEGTGLGLAISRDLARGMGAELTVTSAPGRGSEFCVVLRMG